MVVVHQADADQFPHRLADDVAEERRVFHVAITRGSQRVHVVPDTTPSPFVAQMFEPPPPPRVRRPTAEPPAPARAGGSGGSATSGTSARPGQSLTGDDAVMFAALKELRLHLAAGKPAYTVLPDAALEAIVRLRPTSLQELAAVRGVGPSKLRLYGDAFLTAVARVRALGDAPDAPSG